MCQVPKQDDAVVFIMIRTKSKEEEEHVIGPRSVTYGDFCSSRNAFFSRAKLEHSLYLNAVTHLQHCLYTLAGLHLVSHGCVGLQRVVGHVDAGRHQVLHLFPESEAPAVTDGERAEVVVRGEPHIAQRLLVHLERVDGHASQEARLLLRCRVLDLGQLRLRKLKRGSVHLGQLVQPWPPPLVARGGAIQGRLAEALQDPKRHARTPRHTLSVICALLRIVHSVASLH
mmetsp:Transcript_14698/g.28263  ORF Transcript_14698/g.28263 Transcript_14698/m.28263 type:complete len:228 (-) Transcript_14698:528-1211(-)